MLNIIVEISKYLILIIMLLYTLESFWVFRYEEDYDQRYVLRNQLLLIIFLDFTAFLVIFLQTEELKVLYIFGTLILYLVIVQALYRVFYKTSSILLLNHMCMLLSVGFIMLARLDPDSGLRQMAIAVAATVLAMVIPVMIRKMYFLKKLTWLYAVVGFLMLLVVLVVGSNVNGAKININIGSFTFQPSEFVKIIFVFFVASRLYKKSATFRDHVITTAVAAAYVLVLVLSRDLGSAVIFFAAYLIMVYVSTRRPGYLALGLAGGAGASVVAYFLFGHVRQRVSAWKDPMAVYENEGYQIVQSLFAIGTGGWFGMGLCQGSPESIPVVKNDFIFSAICEELGGIFAICLILVCMSFFLMIVNIALRIKNPFYKLIALGLGTEYAFQVFLTIGGATKFIPMTGVTLPLVSYGGSSVMSTILMLAIIQGLYILREDEDEEFERRRKEAVQRIREREEARRSEEI